jgi:hypothetical protein
MAKNQKQQNKKHSSNQFLKGLNRVRKVTVFDALVKRFVNWEADEENVVCKTMLSNLVLHLKSIEDSRKHAITLMANLVQDNYVPPVRNHTGELKLNFSRQVWIKSKYLPVYVEAYPAEQLSELRVLKVVNGRVVLLMGAFDANDIDNMPRAVVPKIHLTAAPPNENTEAVDA